MLELLKDNEHRNEWVNNFYIDRYKELLLINMSHRGDLDTVKNLLNNKVNPNSKLLNDITSLYLAVSDKHTAIIKILI